MKPAARHFGGLFFCGFLESFAESGELIRISPAAALQSANLLLDVPEDIVIEELLQIHVQSPAYPQNGLDGNGIVSSGDDIVQRGLRDPAASAQRIQGQIVIITQIQDSYLQCSFGTHSLHLTAVIIPPPVTKVTSFPLIFRFSQKIDREIALPRVKCRGVK